MPLQEDFVIEDSRGNYVLVELESPSQTLFVKSGHRSASLTHAQGQVEDWIRYIQDNKSTVERELRLTGISATPRAMIVIGRAKSLSSVNRRKLQVGEGATEILTYDDLRARFATTIANLVGMLENATQDYAV